MKFGVTILEGLQEAARKGQTAMMAEGATGAEAGLVMQHILSSTQSYRAIFTQIHDLIEEMGKSIGSTRLVTTETMEGHRDSAIEIKKKLEVAEQAELYFAQTIYSCVRRLTDMPDDSGIREVFRFPL